MVNTDFDLGKLAALCRQSFLFAAHERESAPNNKQEPSHAAKKSSSRFTFPTSLVGRQVLGLVLAVVEAAGQDDVIVVALTTTATRVIGWCKSGSKVPFGPDEIQTAECAAQTHKGPRRVPSCLCATDLLSGGVFAAEGDGLQLGPPAGERPQSRLARLEGPLQEQHGLARLLLHAAHVRRRRVSSSSSSRSVLAFRQAVQLCDHCRGKTTKNAGSCYFCHCNNLALVDSRCNESWIIRQSSVV